MFKYGIAEKVKNGNFQPVTNFLNRGNGSAVVSSADDIIQR